MTVSLKMVRPGTEREDTYAPGRLPLLAANDIEEIKTSCILMKPSENNAGAS
jgi:hypothetical protein